MIQAITNQQIGLNVITELVIGYMLPGKPIAMMMFKSMRLLASFKVSHIDSLLAWGYITMAQALNFTSE